MHLPTLLLTLTTISPLALALVSPPPPMAAAADHAAPYDISTVFQRSIDDLPITPLRWIGPIEEGGANVTLVGSNPRDLAAQIEKLNPYWKRNVTHLEVLKRETWDMIREVERAVGNESVAAVVGHGGSEALGKRQLLVANYCNQRAYTPTECDTIQQDIDWFLTAHGTGWCAAGPNSCGRFTCSYNSATLMCVAGGSQVVIPCNQLAVNFYTVLYRCQKATVEGRCFVEGQAFYSNPDYNVLIKKTDKGKGC